MDKAIDKCPECGMTEFDHDVESRTEAMLVLGCQCCNCGHEWYEEWKFLQEL